MFRVLALLGVVSAALVWMQVDTPQVSAEPADYTLTEPHQSQPEPADAKPLAAPPAPANPQVTWATSLDEAMRLAKADGRRVLAVFEMDHCTWCTRLDRELEKPAARQSLTSYIPVKINVSRDRATGRLYGVDSCPSLKLLDPSRPLPRNQVLDAKNGYLTADELAAWLSRPKGQFQQASHCGSGACGPCCPCDNCHCRGGGCTEGQASGQRAGNSPGFPITVFPAGKAETPSALCSCN